MRSLIGMTFLNSSVGQRRLRQNGIVLRLGPVVADRRRATLPHRQGHCLDRQDLETLLLWLQRHFLCVPLEHLLEGPAPTCLRIALSVDGNPAELAELVYPLLERYEMPASAFIGGDPRSWREAVAETLWQADATAAGPLLELLEGYSGAALMGVFERTGGDQRRSRSLDLLLRKLERLDPASQQALHAACPVPAPYNAGDWERVRRLENSGLLRFGLRGQEPPPSAGLCAEDCLGRAHRQLQQQCVAPLPVFCQPRATPAAQPGLRAALGRLGYRFAFGARNGLVDTRCDPLDLPRIEVDAAVAARPGRLAWRIYRGARP
ncbi:hypothetical protein [Pseudomonas aeruginosa]|uniref:hypothetical protein n=1 Tax=Pseudomonas aeruginosa TaxID=287 RepID=UPI0009F9009F|nr:hypothetical protein [Pseudomonas aeruginosa]MDA3276036.1 polysaccharide deacetylase family protein [Pseudomonas aeruginosa]ORE58200.1 hypothetical protein B1H15_02130 [Pseudomonas aeruginosa]RPY41286.1 hypothetical protein IPC692_13055 [Pseudomonas aeruginosa]RPY41914.1 hypothetical protein IPC688_27980 [Pseudomonas aeruginosa]WCV93169.1 polysaccharide deacetylase family protein [Pseudomonas aeruginosa]